jgi:hypothetical protein
MSSISSETLALILDEIHAGRLTLAECRTRFPSHADEIQEIVGITEAIAPPRAVSVDPEFRRRARSVLLAEAIAHPHAATSPVAPSSWQRLRPVAWLRGWPGQIGARRATAALAATALLVALVRGAGTVFAAESALPGDPLYPIKVAFDNVPVVLAVDDAARADAYVSLAAKRLSEIQLAQQEGRDDALLVATAAYVDDLTRAEQYLGDLSPPGHATGATSDQLAANLAQQQATLATAAATAPAPVRAPLAQAEAAARNDYVATANHLDDEVRPSLPERGPIPFDRSNPPRTNPTEPAKEKHPSPDDQARAAAVATTIPSKPGHPNADSPPPAAPDANSVGVSTPTTGHGRSDGARGGRSDPPGKSGAAAPPANDHGQNKNAASPHDVVDKEVRASAKASR